MYHIVYLTTNLINQKIYVGIHSTYNLNDGYIGSGTILSKAIKKYGKENFQKQILYFCLTRNDAKEIEKRIVNQNFILLSYVYNKALGGEGGDVLLAKGKTYEEIYGKEKAKELKEIRSFSLKGKTKTKEHCNNIKVGKNKKPYKTSLETRIKLSQKSKGKLNGFYGRNHSEESKRIIGSKSKNRRWKKGKDHFKFIDIKIYDIKLCLELFYQNISYKKIYEKYKEITNQNINKALHIIIKAAGYKSSKPGKAGRENIKNFINQVSIEEAYQNILIYSNNVLEDAQNIFERLSEKPD